MCHRVPERALPHLLRPEALAAGSTWPTNAHTTAGVGSSTSSGPHTSADIGPNTTAGNGPNSPASGAGPCAICAAPGSCATVDIGPSTTAAAACGSGSEADCPQSRVEGTCAAGISDKD